MDLYICIFKQTYVYINVQVRISNYQVMVEEGDDEYLEGKNRSSECFVEEGTG